MRSAGIILAVALVTLPAQRAAPMSTPARGPVTHLYEHIAGTYDGTVVDGGEVVTQITTFRRDGDGRPVADYVVKHPDGTTYRGSFSGARVTGPLTVSFTWADRHGQGIVTLTFAPDGSSFEGTWGDIRVRPDFRISGRRND